MAEVVPQRNRFGKVFVKIEGAGNSPGDLRNFPAYGQPRDVMVAGGAIIPASCVSAAEGFAVDNPVSIALKFRAYRVGVSARCRRESRLLTAKERDYSLSPLNAGGYSGGQSFTNLKSQNAKIKFTS